MNRRRRQIVSFAVSLVMLPSGSLAQQRKEIPRLGFLSAGTSNRYTDAFRQGLRDFGYIEGKSVAIEYRYAEGQVDRISVLADELARAKPSVIVVANTRVALAATKATQSIPIVQANGVSPVEVGLANSLARPGGMVTGVTNLSEEISAKYLELLLAASPTIRRVGFLVDDKSLVHAATMRNARRAATHYRIDARYAEVSNAEQLEASIMGLVNDGVQALVIMPNAWFSAHRARIIKLALAHRLAVISGFALFVEAGALLSYGADSAALHRRAAFYVDRILKGAKPGDLPIEQPMTYEMVVNMKTAKTLGLTIPPEIMIRATQVIE